MVSLFDNPQDYLSNYLSNYVHTYQLVRKMTFVTRQRRENGRIVKYLFAHSLHVEMSA